MCTPYLQLNEEFNLREALSFHNDLKPLVRSFSAEAFSEEVHIAYDPEKPIKHYSSGMKQRVKLGLALFSNSRILLLDEPLSNLDENGITWYKHTVEREMRDRLVIVCSNEKKDESFFCNESLNIEDYKG